MVFTEVERKLTVLHEKKLVVPYFAPGFSMSNTAIRTIINHGNYRMDSFIDYVFSLGLYVTMNTYVIISMEELSFVLVKTRKELGYLQKDILAMVQNKYPSFTPSRICSVENGRNVQRKTFLAYCTALESIYKEPYKWELCVGSNSHLTDDDLSLI